MVKATQRGCIDKLIKQQILKVCKHKGTDLFNYQKDIRNNKKLVFNSNYLPNFSNLKDIISREHLLITPGQEHQILEAPIQRCS